MIVNYKQMILVHHLIETTINRESDKNYQMLFKVDDSLFSGNILQQKSGNYGFKRSFVSVFDRFLVVEQSNFFSPENGGMDNVLRESFFKEYNLDDNSYPVLLRYPHLIFSKIVDLVSKIDNVDEYFTKNFEIPSMLYDLTNLDTKQTFDFYLLNNEILNPVTLIEAEE